MLSRAKACTHSASPTRSHTRAHTAKQGAFPSAITAWLCVASEIHFIPPCFYIHTFPGSLWTTTISNSSISGHLSSRFSASRTNGPRSLTRVKAGTHSAFGEKSHTRAHTAKQVVFWVGGGITTLGTFRTFRKPCVAGYQNGKLCRFWGLVVGAPKERREPSGQRCAYACRCSEASRPRWAA